MNKSVKNIIAIIFVFVVSFGYSYSDDTVSPENLDYEALNSLIQQLNQQLKQAQEAVQLLNNTKNQPSYNPQSKVIDVFSAEQDTSLRGAFNNSYVAPAVEQYVWGLFATSSVSVQNSNRNSFSQKPNAISTQALNSEDLFLAEVNKALGKKSQVAPNCPDFVFEQNLFPGDVSNEVLKVQKFLNYNPKTRVANSGPGSPGNETNYYGPKTVQAVKKFQELFRRKILDPNGLENPTGVWGPAARKVANNITRICFNLKKQNR